MRLLSPEFVRTFPNRIVNIHPSLLPSFPGLNVQQQAIDHGVKVSGCTVHFVDEHLDAGPIILQRVVEVKDDETAETLAAMIVEKEHGTYVEAVKRVVSGRLWLECRRTVFVPE
jgi:phosphoribosylglycinamide formyltransferase-1